MGHGLNRRIISGEIIPMRKKKGTTWFETDIDSMNTVDRGSQPSVPFMPKPLYVHTNHEPTDRQVCCY